MSIGLKLHRIFFCVVWLYCMQNPCCCSWPEILLYEIYPWKISPWKISPVGKIAVRKFCRKEISPYGNFAVGYFAVRKFRRTKFSQYKKIRRVYLLTSTKSLLILVLNYCKYKILMRNYFLHSSLIRFIHRVLKLKAYRISADLILQSKKRFKSRHRTVNNQLQWGAQI